MQKQIKKIIPYFLILLVLVGLFSPGKAYALMTWTSSPDALGSCIQTTSGRNAQRIDHGLKTQAECTALGGNWTPSPNILGSCIQTTSGRNAQRIDHGLKTKAQCDAIESSTAAPDDPKKSPFENALDEHCKSITSGSIGGCLAQLFYFLFFTIPSFLLGLAGKLFNVVMVLALDSTTYKTGFVDQAWVIVRDFSNIFFIFILLYIAIQTILGLGHETKKAIVQVIIMALLINFSMFFTRVVIDSSNILALIFYNKIQAPQGDTAANVVTLKNKGIQEKQLSEKLVQGFDITRLMKPEFFEQAKTRSGFAVASWSTGGAAVAGAVAGTYLIPIPVVGTAVGAGAGVFLKWLNSDSVPPSLLISIIIPAGIIMYYAIYAFFTAGIAFLSRIIELWILTIFAPFAFMSSALPILKKVSTIGWDEWVKRLFSIAFMAPVFMFFLLVIFKIIDADITKDLLSPTRNLGEQWLLETIVLVSIAAFIILALLIKATKYAKKASGEIGEAVTTGIKLAAGLAVSGTAIGGAVAGRAVIGSFMKGASTGDTAAQRFARTQATGVNEMRGRWDTFKGWTGTRAWTGGALATRAQVALGGVINRDQTRAEQSTHSRHTLDEVAKARYQGKSYNELSGTERTWVQNRIDQDILTKNRAVATTATGATIAYGNKQKFSELTDDEQAAITAHLNGMTAAGKRGTIVHGSVQTLQEATRKQGIGSTLLQASRTGSYDIRNMAKLIAKEQSTGFNKLTIGLMSAVAMGMRGGFKTAGVTYGEGQGNFFKDLGDTVTNALKSVKVDVDLSHVGEVKEEKGGGGGHH